MIEQLNHERPFIHSFISLVIDDCFLPHVIQLAK